MQKKVIWYEYFENGGWVRKKTSSSALRWPGLETLKEMQKKSCLKGWTIAVSGKERKERDFWTQYRVCFRTENGGVVAPQITESRGGIEGGDREEV